MKKKLLLACLAFAAPLAAETKVLAFAGSSREDSYNRKLVLEAAEVARQMGAEVTVIDLKDYPMPFYDGDLEKTQGMPNNVKSFRQLMISSDAIIIASPQYNASIPAVLKNALDWASRSEDGKSSHEAFEGKKFAIMSASPGKRGGAKGLVHLQAIIEDIGGQVVQQQVSVGIAHIAFNAKGNLDSPALRQQLQQEVLELLPSKIASKETAKSTK